MIHIQLCRKTKRKSDTQEKLQLFKGELPTNVEDKLNQEQLFKRKVKENMYHKKPHPSPRPLFQVGGPSVNKHKQGTVVDADCLS